MAHFQAVMKNSHAKSSLWWKLHVPWSYTALFSLKVVLLKYSIFPITHLPKLEMSLFFKKEYFEAENLQKIRTLLSLIKILTWFFLKSVIKDYLMMWIHCCNQTELAGTFIYIRQLFIRLFLANFLARFCISAVYQFAVNLFARFR